MIGRNDAKRRRRDPANFRGRLVAGRKEKKEFKDKLLGSHKDEEGMGPSSQNLML